MSLTRPEATLFARLQEFADKKGIVTAVQLQVADVDDFAVEIFGGKQVGFNGSFLNRRLQDLEKKGYIEFGGKNTNHPRGTYRLLVTTAPAPAPAVYPPIEEGRYFLDVSYCNGEDRFTRDDEIKAYIANNDGSYYFAETDKVNHYRTVTGVFNDPVCAARAGLALQKPGTVISVYDSQGFYDSRYVN